LPWHVAIVWPGLTLAGDSGILFVRRFDMSLPVYLLCFILQFVVSVCVLRMFLCESRSTKFIVAAGLAQVSEFSFVLGSRARRFHLISREVSFQSC